MPWKRKFGMYMIKSFGNIFNKVFYMYGFDAIIQKQSRASVISRSRNSFGTLI